MSEQKFVSAENLAFFKEQCDAAYAPNEAVRYITGKAISPFSKIGDVYCFNDGLAKFKKFSDNNFSNKCHYHSFRTIYYVQIPTWWYDDDVRDAFLALNDSDSLMNDIVAKLIDEGYASTSRLAIDRPTTSPYFVIRNGYVICNKELPFVIQKNVTALVGDKLEISGPYLMLRKKYRSGGDNFPKPNKHTYRYRRPRTVYSRCIGNTKEKFRGVLYIIPTAKHGKKSVNVYRFFRYFIGESARITQI